MTRSTSTPLTAAEFASRWYEPALALVVSLDFGQSFSCRGVRVRSLSRGGYSVTVAGVRGWYRYVTDVAYAVVTGAHLPTRYGYWVGIAGRGGFQMADVEVPADLGATGETAHEVAVADYGLDV